MPCYVSALVGLYCIEAFVRIREDSLPFHFTCLNGSLHGISDHVLSTSTSIIYSQQSFMIITGRRMSGCYTCYKIKMDCIDL